MERLTMLLSLIQDLIYKYGRSTTIEMLKKLGIDSAYNYYLDVKEDSFIHFTLLSRANKIVKEKKLKLVNESRGHGPEGVFAVSETYGQFVPEVQLYAKNFNPKNEPLVAVRFKTNTIPSYGFPEEVIWHEDVDLIDPKVLPAKSAESLLSPKNPDADFSVTYKASDAKLESAKFAKFLDLLKGGDQNPLIEAVSTGFNTICEAELLYKTHRGEVYADGDKITKITSDIEEYENALKLAKNPSPYFVRYYSAEDLGNGKYKLTMDKLTPLSDSECEMVDLIMNSLGIEEYMLDDNKRYAFMNELKRNPEYYESFSDYTSMVNLIMRIRRMYLDAKKRGITLKDLRCDNLGKTQNGELVHFDLGAG